MADAAPSWDDLPSFDDLPDAAPQQAQPSQSAGPPAWDALPSWDDLPDQSEPNQRPSPEGPVMSAVREGAHAVIPAAAGLVGAGVGAVVGALTSPVTGPVGPFVGGVGGMVAGSMGADAVQERALHALGFDDSEQRAANATANPKSSFVGGLAPAVATMSPVRGAQVGARALGAGMMGGFEAGQEYLNEGKVDPAKVGIAMAAGAVAPAANRVGEKLMRAGGRMVPGRPNRTANPAADQAHADVDDNEVETAVGDSVLAQSRPGPDQGTTGNPQSAPTRSSRTYKKGNDPAEQARYAKALSDPEAMRQFAHEEGLTEDAAREIAQANYEPSQGDMLTHGDMDPATNAALEAANPTPQKVTPEPAPTAPQPEPFQQQAPETTQSVETGFPKAGEPVAVGENEAAPVPPTMPAKVQEAIAKSKAPEIKGAMPSNETLSDAQKEAGNHLKDRTHDFGKKNTFETRAGDIRRSTNPDNPWEVKLPYDYGYFNNTRGPDGDHIDNARAVYGTPEYGDKHFIIDQKNEKTGKYDEPKVFTYYKDEAAARDAYNRGFSDNKGPDRLHDITEVSREELIKYLARHTKTAPKGPYGEPMPKEVTAKPVKERAVVQDAVAKLRAKGDDAGADALLNAPEDKLAAAIEGKRTRKYGVPSKTGASANFPVDGLPGSTANTKPLAAARGRGHKAVVDWFENSKPPSQMDTSKETNGELLDRLRMPKEAANPEGWTRGPSAPPKEWMLAREAKKLLAKPTPSNIAKYREAERLLRGSDVDVENYRGGNRVDADIANSRRSGDEAVASAEAAQHLPGRNDVEDAMVEHLDAKRKGTVFHVSELDKEFQKDHDLPWILETAEHGQNEFATEAEAKAAQLAYSKKGAKFDVPHEEAESMVEPKPVKTRADIRELPEKTVDAADSELAKIDTNKISQEEIEQLRQRKARAEASKARAKAAAAGRPKEAPVGESVSTPEKPIAGEKRKINVHDADPDYIKRLLSMSETAKKRVHAFEAVERGEPLPIDPKSKARQVLEEQASRLLGDTSGAGHPSKLIADVGKVLDAITKPFQRKYTDPKTWNAQRGGWLGSKKWTPQEEYNQSLSDRFNQKSTQETAQDVANKQWIARLPKEIDKSMREKFALARDENNFSQLTPHELQLYEDHFARRLDDNNTLFDAARAIDPDRLGPKVENHLYHIPKNKAYDLLNPGSSKDPFESINNVSTAPRGTTQERQFMALERVSDGQRFVIAPNDKGYRLWQNQKPTTVKDPSFEFEAGKPYQIKPTNGGQPVDFVMRDARMREVETHAAGPDGKPMEYHKDIALSIVAANKQLTELLRNMQFIHELTNEPSWKARATQDQDVRHENNWTQTELPVLNGKRPWYVDEDLKAVVDSYARPGIADSGAAFAKWRNLSQMITKTIFWNPVVHAANAGVHYTVAKGWDTLNLADHVRAFTRDLPSVLRQDALQKEILDHGGSLMYPGVITKRTMQMFGKMLGHDIQSNPATWDPFKKTFGMGPSDLIKAVYDTSQKMLWSANDMFYTNLYQMHRSKGLSIEGAINATEADFPNYRVQPKLFNSRAVSKVIEDPGITAFGRYHVGMVNALANMIHGIVGKEATPTERFDAVGKLLVLGALGLMIKPMADKVAQKITGNDQAQMTPRGALSLPFLLVQSLRGKQDFAAGLRGVETFSPMLSAALQVINNKDFADKPIIEPGDVAKATSGSPSAAGAVGVQGIEFMARLLSPINTIDSAYKKGQGPGRTLVDQLLGIHDPSQKGAKFERKQDNINRKNAQTRAAHGGRGFLEHGYNRLTGRGP